MRFFCVFSGDKQKSSSLERAKSPHLSISIPAQDCSSSDLMQPRRRTSKSGQASNQERPRSALSPLYSPPYSTTVTGLRRPAEDEEEEFDDKISLEQFLKESNRSPKSRVSCSSYFSPFSFAPSWFYKTIKPQSWDISPGRSVCNGINNW